MIADAVTLSRALFSLLLLFIPTGSGVFWLFYILCGVSDLLDGFLARRLCTESKRGEMLDSGADLLFGLFYALRILPLLGLPAFVWIWTGAIGAVKLSGMLLSAMHAKGFFVPHSTLNRLTGLLIFLLPASLPLSQPTYAAALVCAVATAASVKELYDAHGFSRDRSE